MIFSDGFVVSRWTRFLKRTIDLALAAVVFVLAAPFTLLTALAVYLDSDGPILYCQERVGEQGRTFTVYKFRSMRVDAEQGGTPIWAKDKDDRITRVGRLIRKTRLDELPQLWNVIRGDMSLVGPRPALVWEAEAFPSWAHDRFGVRPGLTGLWQVSGRNRVTMVDGLHLDIRYVASRTLWMDLKILLRTAKVVLGADTR
jgi:lipopolysaccharide/colanic/teichoic acid biosynthesis glycosyltransferase